MADRRAEGSSGSDVNQYDANDIERAVELVDRRMRLFMNVRETLLTHRDNISDGSDSGIARRMATAVISDGPLITQHLHEERVARHDRELTTGIHNLAERLQRENASPLEVDRQVENYLNNHPAPPPDEPEGEDMAYLAKLAGRYVSHAAGEALMPNDLLAAEFAASGTQSLQRTHTCCVCSDDKTWFDIFVAPCGEAYCGGCLQELFDSSLKDESLFPPRCCQQVLPIESRELRLFLSQDVLTAYGPRKIEVETTDRTYCHTCNKFILPATIRDSEATCSACQTITCSYCKSASHSGACEPDEAAQAVLELAETEHWQRCYRCLNMVALSIGCNHMTCRCSAEFCYLCGEKWKNCECVLFDEERLLERAEQVLNRDGGGGGGAGAQHEPAERREERLRQVAQFIQENHECTHPRNEWNRIEGPHECENCHDTLPNFILECQRCLLRVCVRCRRNRVL